VATAQRPRPAPLPDELTAPFWDGAREGRLVIQCCSDCGRYIHTPKFLCPDCLSDALIYEAVSGEGSVYSFTIAEHTYHPGIPAPYVLATIELVEQDGLRVLSNVIDSPMDEVHIGMPVSVSFNEVAPGLVLPQFVPRR
jgi:uncharacterized OB-fold protein